MECDLIITNGTVLSMAPGSQPLADGAVAVRDGRIVAVAAAAELVEQVPTASILDAGGGLILPGFVNTHTHLAMTLLRGFADDLLLQEWLSQHIWPAEGAFMRPDTVAVGTRLAAAECIRAGVTTVRHVLLRPRYRRGAGGCRAARRLARGSSTTRRRLRPRLKQGFVCRASCSSAFAPTRWFPVRWPHAPTRSPPRTRQAAELARSSMPRSLIHLAETRKEWELPLRDKGVTPAAYLADLGILSERTIAAHCVHVCPMT